MARRREAGVRRGKPSPRTRRQLERGRQGGPARHPVRSRRRLLLWGAAALALVVVAGVVAALLRDRLGGGGGGEGPPFDGQAAMELVERQVAFGPRVPNTEGHARMLQFLQEFLRPLADSVAVEEFEHVPIQGDTLHLANVIARFRPDAPSRVLLAAHWDSRPVAEQDPDPAKREQPIPGANDGGSGTAVLLEMARVLSKNPLPQGYGVDLAFLDGEDYGHDPQTLKPREPDMYLGAKEFAKRHSDYRPLFGILLDLVGDKNPQFMQESHSVDAVPEIVRRVWAAAEDLGHGDVFREQGLGYITDDHVYLNQAGIRTMDLIDFDYPAWHTHDDVPANMSAKSLGLVGDVLVELIYHRI
jgi:glutaminyl-peptide cyclotransferase